MTDDRTRGCSYRCGETTRRSVLGATGGLSAAALTGLAGCLGNGEEESEELTVYTNIPFEEIADGYEEETGVGVNYVTLQGQEPITRYVAEADQEQYDVDAICCNSTGMWQLFEDDIPATLDLSDEQIDRQFSLSGMAETYQDRLGDDVLQRAPPILLQIGAFHYHTESVSDPPTSYLDLLDDRWEGETCTQPFTMMYVLQALEEHLGTEEAEEYILDYHDLDPQYIGGGGSNVQSVLGGDNDLAKYIWGFYSSQEISDGAPIDLTFVDELSFSTQVMIRPENAPNPEAAEEFIEWTISESGQEIVQSLAGGSIPAREGMEYGHDHVQQRWEEWQDAHPDTDPFPTVQSPESAQEYADRIDELIGL
ncbi:ABC transporter substrate-binding protein [Natrarchaeobius oligotrophus]|uniref:Extracellular solute-binding protein n=1 Tax=Natrarchaeobius chitinivorans TaxID=1679083 RepID=A0A3N6MF84_NATCH|nr:extracellular solute-binding protein [Natrarchaeobius chitinivorans]RQH02609.1 extracellular solute-binding protein [Natrarchaeobius chitinivorans]